MDKNSLSPIKLETDSRALGGFIDNSFPRENSLRGRSNFRAVFNFKDSKLIRGRHCDVRFIHSNIQTPKNSGNTQFGISISRKAGGAVVRNRLKRIIREFLRNNKDLWPRDKMIVIQLKAAIQSETELISELKDIMGNLA